MTTAIANHKTFYRALRVHILKGATINFFTSPKAHVNLVTFMKNDNRFDILVAIFFAMRPQLGDIVLKPQDLVASFHFTDGESLPDFHLKYN